MISIVIPAYNESGNIEIITEKLKDQLKGIEEYELIFVDDGSSDQTLAEIKDLINTNKFVKFISFSRNFGHQKALKAGLDHAKGDCVISMDADLQHPPEVIHKLIDQWRNGYDVVYTIREDTQDIGLIKRITSRYFYKIINFISEIDIPFGAADFRLLDRKVVNELKRFKENWLFIRGIVSWLGFKQVGIKYRVQPRHMGHSKYSMLKMIAFAIQGVTSFSILPLRMSTILGVLFSFGSFLYALYALYIKFFTDTFIQGWTSILISVLFLGGIQLICIGMIGEYLGKMFIETKERPSYIIKDKSL
jgi:polyisoprenyl-phosphate glycosyltransferase